MMHTIKEVNQMEKVLFVQHFGGVFEHSLWVAEQAFCGRPFHSMEHFFKKMVSAVYDASFDDQLTLLRNHPDLGAKAKMTDASTKEQKGAGLTTLSEAEYQHFLKLNKMYKNKFAFPFIMAVHGKTKEEICVQLQKRNLNDQETEFRTALNEVCKIAYFRLADLIS